MPLPTSGRGSFLMGFAQPSERQNRHLSCCRKDGPVLILRTEKSDMGLGIPRGTFGALLEFSPAIQVQTHGEFSSTNTPRPLRPVPAEIQSGGTLCRGCPSSYVKRAFSRLSDAWAALAVRFDGSKSPLFDSQRPRTGAEVSLEWWNGSGVENRIEP